MRKRILLIVILILSLLFGAVGICGCGYAPEEESKETSLPYFLEDRDENTVYTYLDKACMAVKETFDEEGFPLTRTEYGLDEEGRIIYEHSWRFDRDGCAAEEEIADYLSGEAGCRYSFSRSSCANTSW